MRESLDDGVRVLVRQSAKETLASVLVEESDTGLMLALSIDLEFGLRAGGVPRTSQNCFMFDPNFIAGEDDAIGILERRDDSSADLGHASLDHRLLSTAFVLSLRLVERQSGVTEQKMIRGVGLVADTETGMHKMADSGYDPELSKQTHLGRRLSQDPIDLMTLCGSQLGRVLVTRVSGIHTGHTPSSPILAPSRNQAWPAIHKLR